MKKVLIISAHADDEVLGMGGTLARLAAEAGNELYWLIACKAWEPRFAPEIQQNLDKAIAALSARLKIREVIHWSHKSNMMDTLPKNDLQDALIAVLNRIQPQVIYTPSPWDFNFQHKLMFDVLEMSAKPYYSPWIEEILAYEIPSSSDASFQGITPFPANHYVNIEDTLDQKMKFLRLYETQIHPFPHPRSEEYLRALAIKRGAEAGLKFAEAFHVCRRIIR